MTQIHVEKLTNISLLIVSHLFIIVSHLFRHNNCHPQCTAVLLISSKSYK